MGDHHYVGRLVAGSVGIPGAIWKERQTRYLPIAVTVKVNEVTEDLDMNMSLRIVGCHLIEARSIKQ